ncbi:Gfo/Idh/MocA family protein [Merismopedia glauca]|uniref:Gfo/Idh/MocA family oxidoreductase n=1 Tax=Merismopedia glauca CCAP 1448/3 TaxID=1296344 RepID=A0A2T1CA54_9CYAN|nr:Gfo/Idh/MocA family oxidoreductase [Merismopedia glauca]PSB05119.1 gfo/Idh/MocA family oxidoreductase [Merismopedia glauca CCAP 1448/3]
MRIAIVGCGFVADYYLKTLPKHPDLELTGVMDKNAARASHFSSYYNLHCYNSLAELLADPRVEIVVNLTNPRSHFEVSKACLEAGKHVYSEKPLATDISEAKALVDLAEAKGLYISSAPCTILGKTAQTIGKALQENVVGKVRLVYAEIDDGMVHKMPYQKWLSESGTPWPYKDEFEVGCTLEHAGYYVNWLVAYFGAAQSVTAFSSCQIPDKETDVPLDIESPDFSVACIKFASGVVARITCSIIAPHDHSLRIIGDEGILSTKDCWYENSPVYIQREITIRRKTFLNPWKQKYPLVGDSSRFKYRGSQQIDFAGGVAELASAVREKRSCKLSARYSLHNNEIVLAIHNALETGASYKITSTFEPLDSMPWV